MARYFRSSSRSPCRLRQVLIVSITRWKNAREEKDWLSTKATTDSPSRYWDMVIFSKKMSRAVLPQFVFLARPVFCFRSFYGAATNIWNRSVARGGLIREVLGQNDDQSLAAHKNV